MRCLITGVAGFIGSHLADRLLADGHEILGIDAFIDYYPRSMKERNLKIARSSQRFTFIEGNLLDLYLPQLLDGIDWVFHQAAQAGVRASWGQEFSHYVDYNILATQHLLESALQARSVKRFVYASSSSIYGDTVDLPVVESVMPCPISPYGVTKLAAEHLCTLYYRNFGLPTVSLRYFTVYGPRQRPDMAFHRFCKAIVHHQPVRVFDDGEQTRDFTYISDVIDANIRAAMSDGTIGSVVNIAGGSRVTIRQVIQQLQDIAGVPISTQFERKQYGDVRNTFADTKLAQQLFGYQPTISLYEGLQREFAYIQTLYNTYASAKE